MCGLFGVVSRARVLDPGQLAAAHRVQAHRGPDGCGEWQGLVGQHHVAIGHQRLAIIDLSDAGLQPMRYAARNQYIVFNGELYNYVERARELCKRGTSFATRTDTEVVMALLADGDLQGAHESFNGMWAFAWVDADRNLLVLSRDRAGEKPLYYIWLDGELFFASEIKTLLALTSKRFALNHQVIGEYLVQGLADGSHETFFAGIYKVPAAHYAVLDLNQINPQLKFYSYWSYDAETRTTRSIDELTAELSTVFLDAVRIRLRSDVPVGVLLSGGVDSSAIVAAMHETLGPDAQLNLLSAVSNDSRYDESPFIDAMASHIGRSAHKVQLDLNTGNFMSLLTEASWYHDEPVGSFSHVAHYLLMQRARDLGITVILSGQGADELLCGYKKYVGFYTQWLLREKQYARATSMLVGFAQTRTVLSQFSWAEARRYLPRSLRPRLPDIRGEQLRSFRPVQLGLNGDSVEVRQFRDITNFSVPALTHYEDRMSMAWSREVRLPFLDVRLLDLLLSAPPEYKLRAGWTKYLLRMAMAERLPASVVWRRDKRGFITPVESWLKTTLRPQVNDLFAPDALMFRHNLINREALLKLYKQYCAQPAHRGSVHFRDVFAPVALETWLRVYENSVS